MSWCGGGLISPTPGVECLIRAICSSTLRPGSSPPSPGFAPCAILICNSSALVRYHAVTPKRPEATCLIAERLESPLGIGSNRAGSSPPSPVFDFPPRRFMAIASDSWLSSEMEPKLIAPVAKRLTISLADSTSSIEIDSFTSVRNFRSPRKVHRRVASSLAFWAKTSYASTLLLRAATCKLNIVLGFHM